MNLAIIIVVVFVLALLVQVPAQTNNPIAEDIPKIIKLLSDFFINIGNLSQTLTKGLFY